MLIRFCSCMIVILVFAGSTIPVNAADLRGELNKFKLELVLNPGSTSLGLQNDAPISRKYSRINMPPREGVVNVFLLKRATIKDLGVRTCNCQAILEEGLRYVICDASWLVAASRLVQNFLAPNHKENQIALAIQQWFLHHEIGHHHLEHPTLEPKAWVWRSTNRRFEVAADTVALFSDRIEDGKKSLVREAQTRAQSAKVAPVGAITQFTTSVGRWIDEASEFTRSHPSFARRLEDYVKLLALSNVETQDHAAELTSGLFADLDVKQACDETELTKVPESEDLLHSFNLATRDERKAMADMMMSAIEKATNGKAAPLPLELVLATCQALILGDGRQSCGIDADGIAAPSELSRLLLAQNVLLQGSETVGDEAREQVLSIAEQFLLPLQEGFPGAPGAKAYHVLALKALGYPFNTCGPEGFGHTAEPNADCQAYAKAVFDGMQPSELPPVNLLANAIRAMDLRDDVQLLMVIDLIAIFASQELNETYAPTVIDIVKANEGRILESGTGGFLALMFIYNELRQFDDVLRFVDKRDPFVNVDTFDETFYVSATYEMGRLCRSFYAPNCALKVWDEVLDKREIIMKRIAASTKGSPDAGRIIKQMDNRFELIDFERAIMRVWTGQIDEGLRTLHDHTHRASGPGELAEIWESIAEAHIWRGDAQAAEGALKQAFTAREQDARTQSAFGRYETLSYKAAVAYLKRDRSEFHRLERQMIDLIPEMYGMTKTLIGINAKFAIGGKLLGIAEMKDSLEGQL